MIILVLGILYIGISPKVFSEEPDPEELEKKHLVYVEPTHISETKVDGEAILEPYLKRRPEWGLTFAAGYSTYEPVHMQPSFSNQDYKAVYGTPSIGMFEGRVGLKKNFSGGSFGGELSVGGFQNDNSNVNFVGSVLNIIPIAVGATYYLDALEPDPFYVPYVSGGAYVMIWKETLGQNTVNGSTQVAPYINAGVAFSLDWIDHRAARISYEDSGIESSSVYIEARKYFASFAKKDPDFSNDISGDIGLRIEF